jgi:hypothetical protein
MKEEREEQGEGTRMDKTPSSTYTHKLGTAWWLRPEGTCRALQTIRESSLVSKS